MSHQFVSVIFVSVIVPVFNDSERLRLCLEALQNQTYPKNFYEVVVVDNGSNPDEDIKSVVAEFGKAIATFESKPGSYAARNKGISLAKGEVIAFTDADCIPTPSWIEKGVKTLLDKPAIGLVAGRIDVFFKDANQPKPIELYESITAFPQKDLLEEQKGGATANVFTWRAVFDQVGMFNDNLKSGGDLEWGKRVFLAGYPQVYADDVCVAHPASYEFRQLYKRTVRLMGGAYDLQNQQITSTFQKNLLFLKDLVLDLVPPLMFVVNAFLDSRLQGFGQKFKVSLVMFYVRYVGAWERLRLKAGAVSARG